MTKSNIIILIISIIVVLIILCIILGSYLDEKIKNISNKLNDAEKEAIDKLNDKKEILIKLIEYTEKKYKIESKAFENVKKLNIDSLNSFKSEKVLNKCYKEIIHIKEDNPKQKETKNLKELLKQYDEIELHVISIRTYHNKYTLVYNNLIKKFPYNIISKIKKYNIATLIEGKELSNNFNNDLEV